MKKVCDKGIYFILLLLFIPLSNALSITPLSVSDITVYSNEPKLLNFTIKNNVNYTIYNVSFTSISTDKVTFTFSSIENLSIDEERNITVLVTALDSFQQSFTSTLFFYNLSSVVLTPSNEQVNITSSGFSPQTKSIVQGSQITWINSDTIAHTVTSSLFDATVQPGAQFSFTFSASGTVGYFDSVSQKTGTINIIQTTSSQLVHNPLTDTPVSFSNMNGIKVATSLLYEVIDGKTLTVEHDAEGNGVIKVTNTGTSLALGLFLIGNWTTFQKNNFSIGGGESTFVPFTVSPFIQSVNETGKTYEISLTLRGENVLAQTLSINVTIPTATDLNESSAEKEFDEIIKKFNALCAANPSICRDPKVVEKEVPIYIDAPLPYNYTQKQIDQLNKNYLSLIEVFDRTANIMKSDSINVINKVDIFDTNLNKTSNRIGALEEKFEKFSTLAYTAIVIFIALMVIIGGVGGVGYVLIKVRQSKNQSDIYKT